MNEQTQVDESGFLLDYLVPVARWRWLIVAGTLVGFLLGGVKMARQRPFYKATAYFMPGGGDLRAIKAIGGEVDQEWGRMRSNELTDYFKFEFTQPELLRQLLEREFEVDGLKAPLYKVMGLDSLDDTKALDAVTDTLASRIKVDSEGRMLFQVSYQSADKTLVDDVVNGLLDEYDAFLRRQMGQSTTVGFIKDQATSLSKKLEALEARIVEARKPLDKDPEDEMALMRMEREARGLETRLHTLNQELIKSDIARVLAEQDSVRQIRVVKPASEPRAPSVRVTKRVLVIYSFMAFALSAAAAFGIEYGINMYDRHRDHPLWGIIRRGRRDIMILLGLVALVVLIFVLRLVF